MAWEVVISQRAADNLADIVAYLSQHWPAQVKIDFLAELSHKIELISQMPQMYRASRRKNGVRECVVNRHTIMYYRIQGQQVEIITLQDSRRNPERNDL